MIYPEMNFNGNNRADNYLWNYMRTNPLSDKCYSFHHSHIADTIVDVLLIVDGRGIAVITCRDYTEDSVKGISNNRMIKLSNRPMEYTPLSSSIKGRRSFIDILRKNRIKIDERIITAICCYPFISETDFITVGLDKCSPRELTLLKDDFENQIVFSAKINALFDYIYEVQNIQDNIDFASCSIMAIGDVLVDDFETLLKKHENNIAKEYRIDLYARSDKELNYGICSFLMKNEITSGKIYSSSRAILDGLGEYMTSVKIPWNYKTDYLPEIGYQFVDAAAPDYDDGRSVAIVFNGSTSICVQQGLQKKYIIDIHNKKSIYENIDDINISTPMHLKNEQIRKMFLKAFKVAENEIDIISPWINFGVVDDKFVELMRNALARGVIIKIIYGLNPNSSEYNQSRSNRSDQVARFLQEEFKEYQGQLCILRDNIHYKLVLCDEKFKLEGGYNYLSFVGDYENEGTRKEGSPFGTNIDEIRYLRKEYFNSVR